METSNARRGWAFDMKIPEAAGGSVSDTVEAPRVAVLTFHFHYNYGGVLQAYGLQHALRSIGYEAVFPRTVPEYCRGWIDRLGVLGVRRKGVARGVADCWREFPRRRAFDRFRQLHFPAAITGPAWKEVISDSRTIACVAGSDQVWNLAWMRRWEPYYFLGDLPVDSTIRRVAYGACFGVASQRPDYLRLATPLLSRFSVIGTRTRTTARIVENVTGRRTTPVVDPSLLHDYRELRGGSPFDSGFIMFYGIRPEAIDRGRELALAVKRRTGLPVALVVPESFALESWPAVGWADRIVERASPADWVESIRRCSFLVTDSFHGCLFATANRRPFLSYAQGRAAERTVDFAERYGLGRRVLPEGSAAAAVERMEEPVDFDAVHSRVQADREASLRFLAAAIVGRDPSADFDTGAVRIL
jgi:hypothetical protein